MLGLMVWEVEFGHDGCWILDCVLVSGCWSECSVVLRFWTRFMRLLRANFLHMRDARLHFRFAKPR